MFELKSLTIALVVIAVLSSAVAYLTRVSNTNRSDVLYGNQAASIVLGARSFTMANRATIIAAVTANGGNAVAYTVANATGTGQLQAAGAIDPSIIGATPTGGGYCLMYRSYNGGVNLQGVLTVVGETSAKTTADANAVAGAAGTSFTGYVSGGSVIYPGGSQPLAAFTGAQVCAPGANAFAALITDGDTIGTATWLCRTVYPNNASCATMAQNLGLGGNSITGILNETGTGTSQFANYNATTGITTVNETGTGVSTFPTYTATTSVSSPAFYETSDRALKKNIRPIGDPCALLDPIHGRRWERRADNRADFGVIAQDVQRSMPELVTRSPRGFRQVNYNGLSAPIIECEKQERRQLAGLAAQLAELQGQLAALRAQPMPAEAR